MGKVIEKAAAKQFIEHIDKNSLMEPNQSAYYKHHSMESCLLKIKTDILDAVYSQKVMALILLDASAAFDTIHHDILLQRLKTKFAFRGTVLKWMESYIRPHTQRVVDHIRSWNCSGKCTQTHSVYPVYKSSREYLQGK